MNTLISRRTMAKGLGAAAFLPLISFPIHAASTQEEHFESGGIGWPRDIFEGRFGTGSEVGNMVVYANPTVDGSELSVRFTEGIATFIDIFFPEGIAGVSNVSSLITPFLPEDATTAGRWDIISVDGTPRWTFEEHYAESMNMAGSGATRMMTTVATTDDQIVRTTISLAASEAGSGFVPAVGSVGVGNTIDEWISVWGDGHDGRAATGHYEATWDIDPWSKVVVFSQRSAESDAIITQVDAISNPGTDEESAINFAQSILPQQSQLVAGYSSYPVTNRNQGWGMSTWNLSENERMLLCMIGAGDNSGNVLQVATSLYRAEV